MKFRLILVLLVGGLLAACNATTTAQTDWNTLQVHVGDAPAAAVPADLQAQMSAWGEVPQPNPDEAALGHLLFFDPLLSKTDTVSCASCHQPDLGLSDGRAQPVGITGVPLRRSAMQLWNVSLESHFTWDGRASDLHQQMLEGPLINPDEMGNSLDELVTKVEANETYATMFDTIYGGTSAENIAAAITAFQETLISNQSPFDKYAAGDFYALTGAQRRGFEVFRSDETNCIKCHELPTFSSDEFKIIGVGEGNLTFDAGVGAITGHPDEVGAFAVPTLRNVALSAPYMHTGVEQNLNDVISFYLNGGGDNLNIPRSSLDPDLKSFNLNNRELNDLKQFLLALTDESNLPAIPEELPSGLPTIQAVENPARAEVAASLASPRGEPRTLTVAAGTSIQNVIDRAQPGDTVVIEAGQYFEMLDIDVSDITIKADGVELMARPFTPIGITTRNDNITIIGLTIKDFPKYNIDRYGGSNLRLENVTINGEVVTATIP